MTYQPIFIDSFDNLLVDAESFIGFEHAQQPKYFQWILRAGIGKQQFI